MDLAKEGENIGLVPRPILELGRCTDNKIAESSTLQGHEVVHVLYGHASIGITKAESKRGKGNGRGSRERTRERRKSRE